MKSNEAELMQKRFRVGTGPSSNTCPRWAEHLEHRTSVRTKPGRVKTSNIFAPTLILRTRSIHQSHIFTCHIEQWMKWVHPNLMFTELVSWEWCCRQASSIGRGERPAAASRRSAGGTGHGAVRVARTNAYYLSCAFQNVTVTSPCRRVQCDSNQQRCSTMLRHPNWIDRLCIVCDRSTRPVAAIKICKIAWIRCDYLRVKRVMCNDLTHSAFSKVI